MSRRLSPKWVIPDADIRSPEERREYWVSVHEDYTRVFSLTRDPGVQARVVHELLHHHAVDVVIPGCGTETVLQHTIVRECPHVRKIVCTDFQEVLDLRREAAVEPRITYLGRDSGDLRFVEEFDATVIVNSILSDSDAENRRIVASCARSLRPGGVLIGFFPTIFCALEIAHLEQDASKLEDIDMASSSCHERVQQTKQVFYTPLRLRQILRESGLDLISMNVFFCDSKDFAQQARRLYRISDSDISPYELFIVATKRPPRDRPLAADRR